MADSTVDSELVVLIDTWPGYPSRYTEPAGGFDNAAYNNVATAFFKAGEKFQVWNESSAGVEGMSTFIYLQVGTQNSAVAIAAKTFCVPASATIWYQVGNNPDADILIHTGSPLLAIAISALTDAYWGFFWCGGVCPESHVAGLGGTYLTDSNVVPGPLTAHNLNPADAMGFGPIGGDTEGIVGWSLATDAA